jgi:hypothetical protein
MSETKSSLWKFGDSDDLIRQHFQQNAEAYAKEAYPSTIEIQKIYVEGYLKSLDLVLAYADTSRAHIAALTNLYNKERSRVDAAEANVVATDAQNG